MKIIGNEPINAIIETNSIGGNEFLDCNHKGITLKQHMVIEFTKAQLSHPLNSRVRSFIIKEALMFANEVIKQLNEEKQ